MVESATVSGFVKWYDPKKGLGFVVSDKLAGDILLHSSALMEFGQSSISRGAAVTIKVVETSRGHAVDAILHITPDPAGGDDFTEQVEEEDLADLQFQAARVKWFSDERGYGFVNIWGDTRDYFLGSKALNKAGMTSAECGEALSVALGSGGNGDCIAAVRPWHL